MAEPETDLQSETLPDDEVKLKYLDFVRAAAIYSIVCFSSLYEFAKENAGPLQLGVQSVEDSVRTVLAPLIEKFHDVPFEFLKFVDGKVENVIGDLESCIPSLVQGYGVVDAAKAVAGSVRERLEPTARDLYVTYEPVAEQLAVVAWRSMNRLPLFPEIAGMVVPTAAYWTEKYNQAVCYAEDRGYGLAGYLPLIPVEKIAQVFEKDGSGSDGSSTGAKAMIME